MILQRYYGLGDNQVEYQILDRTSFKAFLGLETGDKVPDEKTVWSFRERITKTGLVEELFEQFISFLEEKELILNEGQMIDASFTVAPRQRNTREENKKIKNGAGYDLWNDKPNKKKHKYINARWTKKNGETFYGYKNHAKVDTKSKFINKYVVTDASVYDSQALDDLLEEKDKDQEFYATIFRASHHYYYNDISSLRRPPNNGILKTQLKIRAYNLSNTEINGSHCPSCRFLGLGSAIKMYNPQRNSRDIYGTVIHELAHASHWNMDRSSYNNSSTIVAESWARGVQWALTRMVYPDYVPPYFTNYTGVVEDMIDGISGYDQVSGYSIRQIEDALNGQSSWTGWRDNIKNSYSNGTKNNLDALFNYWD